MKKGMKKSETTVKMTQTGKKKKNTKKWQSCPKMWQAGDKSILIKFFTLRNV